MAAAPLAAWVPSCRLAPGPLAAATEQAHADSSSSDLDLQSLAREMELARRELSGWAQGLLRPHLVGRRTPTAAVCP